MNEKKNDNKCYICLEKINIPIYPSGCSHGICKKHLKVN